MLDFIGMWEQAKQELEGMWASLDTNKSAAQASDAIKRYAGTPENANMVEAIEESRSGGAPVQLEATLFEDTTSDTTVADLSAEEAPASNGLDFEAFKSELIEDEDSKAITYKDTEGNLTVGVGHKVLDTDALKLGSEVDAETIDRMLEEDASSAVANAESLVHDWEGLPSQAKHALSNMTFQLGKKGVSKFEGTLDLINRGDYRGASVEMLDSKWAEQTPNRAKKISRLMASAAD